MLGDLLHAVPAILFQSIKGTEEATMPPVSDIIAHGFFSWPIMYHA